MRKIIIELLVVKNRLKIVVFYMNLLLTHKNTLYYILMNLYYT